MATLTMLQTTTQVRPWPAGGAWNNVAVGGPNNRTALKTTNYGVTLPAGSLINALRALNSWLAAAISGTADRRAQKALHAVGVEVSEAAQLSNAQAGNGQSTNVVDRGTTSGPAIVAITTVAGATPTCTYQLEGSLDNSSFFPLSSADSGTPNTFSTGTFTITSSTTVTRIVDPTVAWRYLRLTYSANTNITNTANAQVG